MALLLTPYDWQTKDVVKLETKPSRLDASECGTGKTIKGGLLVDHAHSSPTERQLWVGPNGTLKQSRDKLLAMGIDIPMTIIDRHNRNQSWNYFVQGGGGLFFVHWEALRLLVPELTSVTWAQVFADEVQRMQNRKSLQTKALKKLNKKVGAKTGVSGNPITGSNDKYWSILNWFYPKEFTSYWKFYDRYVDYEIEYTKTTQYRKINGPLNEAELLARVEPYYVRHLKKEQCCPEHPEGVMPWLPDKYYDEIEVELTPQQRRAWNQMRKDMLAWVGEHEDEPLPASIAIAQHTRMNQFACAYAETATRFDPRGNPHLDVILSEPSSKLIAVQEYVQDNSQSQMVIWTGLKQLAYLFAERCKREKISFVTYTGDNINTREAGKESFIKGNAQLFIGVIQAGGEGVDGLQLASSTMIFLDRVYPTTSNIQAEDRLWRDGQANAVQVIDIVAADTHDRGRHGKLAQSWADIKRVLGDKKFS